MSQQRQRRFGKQVVGRCMDVLGALRALAIEEVVVFEERVGEWYMLPATLSRTTFRNHSFPGVSDSTVRNWMMLLRDVGLYAYVDGMHFVRVDACMTSVRLGELLNKSDDATSAAEDVLPPANEVPDSPAPAGTDLKVAAAQVPSGSVGHPLVAAADVDAILARAEKTARLLQELKERRAAEPELRAQLAAAQVVIAQYERRIAEMTAELELARTVPALPARVAEMATRVDDLLDELDVETQ